MSDSKESELSFKKEGKESFKQRLKELIGHRSVRSVARQWGLSFSTLNNYLNRGTDPSLSAVRSIAKAEGVSIDWLASGETCTSMKIIESNGSQDFDTSEGEKKLSTAWLMVLESIEPDEALSLIRLIHRKGVEGLLGIISESHLTQVEEELLKLPTEEKERLMALHEAKKGASEDGELDITPSPASDNKRQAS